MSSVLLTSISSQAYDVDTHFYSTYAMARYAGIRHEAAEKIALATQWMDESYISDPTSMIVLPVTGVRKRRLLHFPSQRKGTQLSSQAQQKVLGFEKFELAHSGLIKVLIDLLGYEGDSEQLKALNLWT